MTAKTVYKLLLNEAGYVKYCDEYEYEKNEIAKSKTWNLEYNSDNRLVKAVQSESGFQTTYTLTYKNGDATESSTVSQKEGKETNRYQIFYTSTKVTSPIVNKRLHYVLRWRFRYRVGRFGICLLCRNVRKGYQASAYL